MFIVNGLVVGGIGVWECVIVSIRVNGAISLQMMLIPEDYC